MESSRQLPLLEIPEQPESFAVPSDEGIRLHDGQSTAGACREEDEPPQIEQSDVGGPEAV